MAAVREVDFIRAHSAWPPTPTIFGVIAVELVCVNNWTYLRNSSRYTAVAHVAFCFCCLVWGSSFILLERVTHVFGPVEIALWRLFSGAAALAAYWWFRNGTFRMERRDWLYVTLAALAFTAPPQVIQAYVLGQGHGHGFFGTLVTAIPLLTILVSVPMLGILPSARELAGVLGGLVCMWLLLEDGFHRGMSLGLLALAFIIPLTSAVSNTFIKWKLAHLSAVPLTTAILAVAGMALMPLQFSPTAIESLDIEGPTNAVVAPITVFYMILLGVVASGISTMVFIWMILEKGPLYAGMTTYVVPVLALLWGTVDNEPISSQQMLAIIGVLAMVALVQYGSRPINAPDDGRFDAMAAEPHLAVVAASELAVPTTLTSPPESQVA